MGTMGGSGGSNGVAGGALFSSLTTNTPVVQEARPVQTGPVRVSSGTVAGHGDLKA